MNSPERHERGPARISAGPRHTSICATRASKEPRVTAPASIVRKGSILTATALLVGGLGVVTASPAQTTPNFTTYTTGLGSNTVYGVYAVGSTIYAATAGGLSISTNGGTSFTNRTTGNGLGGNVVRGVFAVGSTIYAATDNGLSISTDGGTSFTNRNLRSRAVFGVFASGGNIYAATYGDGLAISTNGGTSFTYRSAGSGFGDFLRGVYAVGSTIYAATDGSGVAISADGGANWDNRTTGLGDNVVLGVYANGSTIYAATSGGLSISTNGGTSFTNRTTLNGLGDNNVNGVYAVGSTVYAATDGGLSISTNGGASFTNKTTTNGLGSNVVFGVYADGSTVYAATNGGVSISTNSGGDSSGSSAPIPQTHLITLDVTSGYRCNASQLEATRGTWVVLPKASECTPPTSNPRAVLLGWATSPTFPVAIAQRQVSNGWGAYETYGPSGSLTGVFIPAGKSALVSGGGILYSIWSE